MRTAVVLLLLAGLAPAAPVPKAVKAKRPDAEVFVGEWHTHVTESNGVPMSKAVWTFDEDLTMWSKSGGGPGQGTKWVIKIDAEKSPKEIDIGPDYKGIYEFDGDDIRILYASGTRPPALDPAKGYYTVLRRVEKK